MTMIKKHLPEARNQLSNLPQWIKYGMLIQLIFTITCLICLTYVVATFNEQLIAFWNVAASLSAKIPGEQEFTRTALKNAVQIGVDGRPWLWALGIFIMLSTIVGSVIVGMTKFKRT